ncbi:MAG: TonB-dependent receptor [Alistipes sp.]|nr:TonB-dependent receptor [Alistipes sp.]
MRKTLYYGLSLLFCGMLLSSAMPAMAADAEVGVPMEETSQQGKRSVTGQVLYDKGYPLPGATVLIKGRPNGAITDADGKFSLEVSDRDVLEVSYLGFIDQDVEVRGKSNIVVNMQPLAEMEEIVVTGFVEQKKESIVASIETISPKDLRVPSSNLTTALAGRVAGLISYQRSGEPGKDNAEFFIRGVTTFGYAQSPMILLDGFEVSANELAQVDPDNIENFSIMKDATAAALYGSKGANGVISVTTKMGREGKLAISFRHESRFSMPTMLPETVDGVTYMKLYNEALYNDNPLSPPRYSSDKIAGTIAGVNSMIYPNINWYDAMFENFTYNSHYAINASGGGKVARYYMALAWDRDTGILKDNDLNNFRNNIDINRYNILAKINVNLTRTTRFDINLNSIFQDYNGPLHEATSIFNSVMSGNPVEFPMVWQPDEEHQFVRHVLFGRDSDNAMANPYAEMVRGFRDGFASNIITQATLEQDFGFLTQGLLFRAKASIGAEASNMTSRSYSPYYYTLGEYDVVNDVYTLVNIQEGSEALGAPANSNSTHYRSYYELGLHYNRTFADAHDVTAQFIYTMDEDRNTSGSTIEESLPFRNQGLRGRLTYGYKGRYMVEASLTYNGSEKFHKSHRWGLFPAIAVGYMISNEKFWQDGGINRVIPKLKFKYSWGRVGNDNIGADRFLFLSHIGHGGPGYIFGQNFNNGYGGFTIGRDANNDIQWEIAEKQNIGIEMNIANIADIQVEYFHEYRSHIYMKRENLPPSMGLTADVYGNLGEVESGGIDGSIDIKKGWSNGLFLQGRFNFTYAGAEIRVAPEPNYNYPWRSRVGHPVNQTWGYFAERLFIDQSDIDNSPSQTWGVLRPGDIKYKDINDDGVITADDMVPMGYPTSPEINYGVGLSIGYKGFDISAFAQGQDLVSFYIDRAGVSPFIGRRNTLSIVAEDHWSVDNPVSETFWPRLSTTTNENNLQQSSWWLRNGRIFRLKTLEVGYTFPEKWLKKTKAIQSARVYFSSSNLFKIDDFEEWDIEMGSNGLGYPLQRVFSVGVHMTF